MSRDPNIGTRRLVAMSRLGRRIVQPLPPDKRAAETWVRYYAEACVLVAEKHADEGECWTFEVRQPYFRTCCNTHVDHAHGPDCDDRPICSHCHAPVHYERGITGGLKSSGTSAFVHDETGARTCADGFGLADIDRDKPKPKPERHEQQEVPA